MIGLLLPSPNLQSLQQFLTVHLIKPNADGLLFWAAEVDHKSFALLKRSDGMDMIQNLKEFNSDCHYNWWINFQMLNLLLITTRLVILDCIWLSLMLGIVKVWMMDKGYGKSVSGGQMCNQSYMYLWFFLVICWDANFCFSVTPKS